MMKKLLLGSTALAVGGLIAAPAMAADPIKIGVGGYYQFYAMAGGIEGTYALNGTSLQYKSDYIWQEGEIHFIGQSKLDNGTTVGVRVELEGWDPAATTGNAQIDEAFLFAFGDWGRVEFGALDNAGYKMFYGTPSALLAWGWTNVNSGIGFFNAIVGGNNLALAKLGSNALASQFQDAERINYYTPRFAGLQVGVGYAPKINVNAPGAASLGLSSGPGGIASVCGYANATAVAQCPTNDFSWQDEFDVGVNYLNKFGDVSIALHGAYLHMNFVPGTQPFQASANQITGANLGPWNQAVGGAQISFAGFTLGGNIGWDNNGLGSNYYTGADNDTRYYTLGLMYETGPWQVSVGGGIYYYDNGNGVASVTGINAGLSTAVYGVATTTAAAFGTNPNAGALSFGTETASRIEVGANYALGPGIKLTGGVVFNNATGPSNSTAGQSWAAMLGMDLRF